MAEFVCAEVSFFGDSGGEIRFGGGGGCASGSMVFGTIGFSNEFSGGDTLVGIGGGWAAVKFNCIFLGESAGDSLGDRLTCY